jgi:D-alanyl-D-alanine carboxypeptidase
MKKIIVASLIILLPGILNAQTVPAALQGMLNNTLDSMLLALDNKSLSASVQMNNTAVWEYATGISSDVPWVNATPADAYQYCSIGKTLTAACVLQLVDEGVLSLDDSIHQWLDTMGYVNPDITIRQLLRHQSGLYDVLDNPASQPTLLLNPDSIWTLPDFINTFIQPPPAAPGGLFSYCNTGYLLLGMIIEQATGNPFYTEIRNRFLTPLSLNTVGIPSLESYSNPVAHVWLDTTGDGVTEDAHLFFYPWFSINSAVAPAGGYYGTAADLSRWMRAYMRGDLHSAAIMSEAKTTISAGGMPVTYGLGLMKKTFLGLTGYGHGGDLGYSGSSWYFPAKDISITVLNNDGDYTSWQLIPVVTALLKTYNQWEATAVEDMDESVFRISAYPNPFQAQLFVSMHLDVAKENVKIVMTNAIGETIASMEKESLPPGDHKLDFTNLSGLSQGMYFVSVYIDGNRIRTVKLVR